jgi:hypothetical protein
MILFCSFTISSLIVEAFITGVLLTGILGWELVFQVSPLLLFFLGLGEDFGICLFGFSDASGLLVVVLVKDSFSFI